MLRTLLVLASLILLTPLSVYAAGHGMCGKMENFKTNIMADNELDEDQQKQLMVHLDEAVAMCDEGKEEEAAAMMKEIKDEFARAYFDQLMESGN